jgi:hypothetical protein
MPGMTEVQGVPENRVGSEVQALVFAGATKIECEKQPDGNWTIRAS